MDHVEVGIRIVGHESEKGIRIVLRELSYRLLDRLLEEVGLAGGSGEAQAVVAVVRVAIRPVFLGEILEYTDEPWQLSRNWPLRSTRAAHGL